MPSITDRERPRSSRSRRVSSEAIGYLADPYGNAFCSGTLIESADVVVTAQHCTTGSSTDSILFGLEVREPRRPHPGGRHRGAPLARRRPALPRQRRRQPGPQAEPLAISARALSGAQLGSQVEAAGYGETHDGSTGRYFAALTLADMNDEFYMVDGQGQRGICFGDSGGPLLVDLGGYAVVAGVESYGDPSCVARTT